MRKGLAIVGLGFAAMLASSAGQSYWLAIFVDDMIVGTGLSRTSFSAIYAAATLCSTGTVLALGRLVDRRGPVLAWVAVSCGLAVGCALASVASGAATALLALALLRSCGQGSFPLLGTLVVAAHFDRWRGRALAVANFGSTLAAALLPAMAVALIATLGWRHAYLLTGVVVLVAVTPLALFIRRLIGTTPSARLAAPLSSAIELGSFPWRDGGTSMLVILAAPPLVTTAAVFHATSILGERGLSAAAAAGALGVLAVTGAVGAIGGGLLIDRVGVRVPLIAKSLLLAGGAACLLAPGAATGYVAYALLGLASGLNVTASGDVWARTYGVVRLGALQSTGDAARIAGAAIGPLPLAVSLAVTDSYDAGLILLAAFSISCAVLAHRWQRSPRYRTLT